MWSWILMPLAMAQADVEVIVYDDAFARWDDTRWLVEAELVTPLGTSLMADANRGVTSYAFQVHAVLACRKDAVLSKRKLEVRCALEDVALVASTYRHGRTPAAQAVAQDVLQAIDGMLTGAEVQLQVDAKGGVTHVDIEGLTASNERERMAQEGLRQVVMRVMSGYHLRIPDAGQRSGQVLERNSALMEVPSLTGTQGSTVLVHTVSAYGDHQLVQSLGEGTVSASVPAPRTESERTQRGPDDPELQMVGLQPNPRRTTLFEDSLVTEMLVIGGAEPRVVPAAWPPDELGQPLPQAPNGEGGVLNLQLTYALTSSGVALFERSTGILTERVWTVDGTPTASSGDGLQTVPFRNLGRLIRLDPDDHPDLGPTGQVAPPGQQIDGLPPWRSLLAAGSGSASR